MYMNRFVNSTNTVKVKHTDGSHFMSQISILHYKNLYYWRNNIVLHWQKSYENFEKIVEELKVIFIIGGHIGLRKSANWHTDSTFLVKGHQEF